MNLGFVGAGKVGVTLGRYFTEQKTNAVNVSGYYSRTLESAQQAATWTNSRCYSSLSSLVSDCDIIFFTLPDSLLHIVWETMLEECNKLSLQGKMFCHCSGAHTSKLFQNQADTSFYTYSIHPLFAIHSKEHSFQAMGQAFFTLEGEEKYLPFWCSFLDSLGNPYAMISAENKVKYHAAAVFSSNLVLSVTHIAENLLIECGFTSENAKIALSPILKNNVENYSQVGLPKALTGPVERGDGNTLTAHLKVLEGEQREIYKLLSQVLIPLAKEKNPELDVASLNERLNQEKF